MSLLQRQRLLLLSYLLPVVSGVLAAGLRSDLDQLLELARAGLGAKLASRSWLQVSEFDLHSPFGIAVYFFFISK